MESTEALMGEHKRRFEERLREMAAQLDQRALRIQRLNAQLRHIAHGAPRFHRKTTRDEGKRLAPAQIRTEVTGFRVLGDSHYTTGTVTRWYLRT